MAGYHAEALVLKRSDFGEADRILTLYTRYRGKLHVIAKGVRRIHSRKGGNVEPVNWIRCFCAEGRNLDVLTEVETINAFQPLKDNLVLVGYAYHVIELLDRFLPDRDPHPSVFLLAVEMLQELIRHPRKIIVAAFEIKLLDQLGFWSSKDVGLPSPAVVDFAETLRISSWGGIRSMVDTDAKISSALEIHLKAYLEKVAETSLKSKRFLQQITNATIPPYGGEGS
ncbi:MAG: DNA repair protein RecO [bacterium]|nr:DNA repair protein RecO [bacterium]